MRIILTFLASLLLASNFGAAQQQTDDSCGFVLQGEPTQPTVKGPDDIVPLVHVVEQPDSPLEVVSVDLEGMWLSISNEQHTEKDCAKYTIRNRSNRAVQGFSVVLRLATIGGAGGGVETPRSLSLAAGQMSEISACGVTGTGSAKNNNVRLLVYVASVDLGNCYYKPSVRIPRSLKIDADTPW